MFHPELLNFIKQEKARDGFIYPFYDHFSIVEIGPTILSLFNIHQERNTLPREFLESAASGSQRIILFTIDGLGYNHVSKFYEKVPFFNTLQEKGEIYPLTSVFPSTTPAALTTIHTGLTPQEHGLPEWTVYFEEAEAIIEPLMFRRQKTHERDGLLKSGLQPSVLFEGKTVYQQLEEHGIPSYYFIYEEYYPSAYSSVAMSGSTVITFRDGEDLMIKLLKTLEEHPEPAYFCVYWSKIDSIAHAYGPESFEHRKAIGEFSDLILKNFIAKLNPTIARETLLLLTADHGQTQIKGEDILYLGHYVYLNERYIKNKKEEAILPTGAPHDVFLFIDPSKISETVKQLRIDLQNRAEVIPTEEAFHRGLFGLHTPVQRFKNRVGNVLILPKPGNHIWYEHFPKETFLQLGTHGGLSEEEMIVPFGVAKISDLQQV